MPDQWDQGAVAPVLRRPMLGQRQRGVPLLAARRPVPEVPRRRLPLRLRRRLVGRQQRSQQRGELGRGDAPVGHLGLHVALLGHRAPGVAGAGAGQGLANRPEKRVVGIGHGRRPTSRGDLGTAPVGARLPSALGRVAAEGPGPPHDSQEPIPTTSRRQPRTRRVRSVKARRGAERAPGTAGRGRHGWAQRGSNPRPLVCKTRALPLSYTPSKPAQTSERGRDPRTRTGVTPEMSRTAGVSGHQRFDKHNSRRSVQGMSRVSRPSCREFSGKSPGARTGATQATASSCWRCSSRSRPSGIALWTDQRIRPSLSMTYDERCGQPLLLVEDAVRPASPRRAARSRRAAGS